MYYGYHFQRIDVDLICNASLSSCQFRLTKNMDMNSTTFDINTEVYQDTEIQTTIALKIDVS